MIRNLSILTASLLISIESHAIIIIPIPNLAFPRALSMIRDALETSTDTRALATVGEDKVFGGRYWVWGQASGKMTQADADSQAMRKCEASLANAKAQMVAGKPLYDFGSNRCELYKFINATLNLPDPIAPPSPVQPPAPAPVAIQASAPVTPPAQTASSTSSIAPSASAPASAPPVQSSTSQQSEQKGNTDIVQRMRDLDTLYRQNLITKEEYERKKKQLLDAM